MFLFESIPWYSVLMWFAVLVGLILLNELARLNKWVSLALFLVLAVVFFICKIPVLGPLLLVAVVPVAVLAFVAINTVWLRIAHHFFHVPWDGEALFNSFVVQTGYAIL